MTGLVERVLDGQPCPRLADWAARGGGRSLEAARAAGAPGVIGVVEDSGLRGRGGAGFPTGTKWRTVAAAASAQQRTTVVVNAAEGEPGTFKDRELLRLNPYRVLEGALVAALAVDAAEVVVAVKGSFTREAGRVRAAMEELRAAGWTDGVALRLVEGPGEYLFGEETGLLEVLEGRQPFPRVAPPYRRGLDVLPDQAGSGAAGVHLAAPGGTDEAPVLVDNVETLANVPAIVTEGPEWFREVGTAHSPGTLVCTVTGRTRRHAVGEVSMGTPLREAIEVIGGGPLDGQRIVAVMSGVANALVPADLLDTPLTYEDMRAIGSGLGAGGFVVFDDRTDLVAVAHGVARFLAVESCGQCAPCKRDGLALASHLGALASGDATAADLEALPDRLNTVADGARCFLATQQQQVIGSFLRLFPEDFRSRTGGRRTDRTDEPVLPLVDLAGGRAVLDSSHLSKQPDWSHDATWDGAWPAALLGREPVVAAAASVGERDAADTAALASPGGDTDPLATVLASDRELCAALDALAERPLPGAGTTGRPGGGSDGVDGRDLAALHDLLVGYLDVHRRVLHPMARRVADDAGERASDRAEHDEAAARAALAQLEQAVTGGGPTQAPLAALRVAVAHMVDTHEQVLLPLLRASMDDGALAELADALEEAMATGPEKR